MSNLLKPWFCFFICPLSPPNHLTIPSLSLSFSSIHIKSISLSIERVIEDILGQSGTSTHTHTSNFGTTTNTIDSFQERVHILIKLFAFQFPTAIVSTRPNVDARPQFVCLNLSVIVCIISHLVPALSPPFCLISIIISVLFLSFS